LSGQAGIRGIVAFPRPSYFGAALAEQPDPAQIAFKTLESRMPARSSCRSAVETVSAT
jgi:hypothetical protein